MIKNRKCYSLDFDPPQKKKFTYVNDVPLLVHHDVAVVSVLDLQEESQHAVRCHRCDEVPPGRLELGARLLTVLLDEVAEQIRVRLSAQLVPGLGLRDALNDTAPRFRGNHFVREQVEIEPGLLKDVLEQLDHLQGQDVLPAVVAHLEDKKIKIKR